MHERTFSFFSTVGSWFCSLLVGLALVLSFMSSANAAGPPPQPNAAQIQLALNKLGVVGSALYIAAHPDDENTQLLAYLGNGVLLRAGYLSATRGDGGQNLIGPEKGPELGLIRTQELLAARRIDGAEQFFTRARDFGFSKSPDETLKIWGREPILADMVQVIRSFRPDVIITRFSPGPADTHGHHTASAMLAVQAFHAAADPKFHPEQLTGDVTPWQARRIFWNRSSWSMKPGEDMSGFASLDVGGYQPLLGVSFGEMAADSRTMHKSQGFGIARSRGPDVEYFKLLDHAPGGDKINDGASGGILSGLDFSWARFKGTARLRGLIEKAARQFQPAAPQASIPALLEIDAALDAAPDPGWRVQKKKETRALIAACAGLFVDATAADFRAAPGTDIDVVASALNRSPFALTLREIRWPANAPATAVGHALSTPAVKVAAGKGATPSFERKQTLHLPADLPLTTPYWLVSPPEAGLYPVADARQIGAPEIESPLQVEFVFTAGARTFTLARSISFKWTDPVMGERYRPLEVTPAVSVRPDTDVLMFPDGGPRKLTVNLIAGAPAVTGVVRPTVPAGWSIEPASAPFSLTAKGAETSVTFAVRAAHGPSSVATTAATLHVVADVGERHFSRGIIRIEHPHIPTQTLLVPADVRLVPLPLLTAGTRIGYLPGPGDDVPASLRRVGYDVMMVSDEMLAAGPTALGRFDAIVVGVRAFNTDGRLRAAHATLMAYVEAGGVLVAQYNTNNRLGPLSTAIGPYPFEIGHGRVTDQEAAVTVETVNHPALSTPNVITARDFDGWVQERGLYFAETWDPRYETVLSMHDPGEHALAGSILWAHHGKGTFVYTGLAFFRQLPEGVPGAFRLFANLLAGGHGPHGR
ncbi:MAG TPA: PIG-L family deacetylase [Polyangia bacterium]|jgi:LmbE family N-acetylglucosaminyl deacetylase|nr:PIG-L family deacetylase [Polyangia bacterium]